MDFPVAGFLGAMAGTIIATIVFTAFVGTVERSLRAQARSETADDRAELENKVSVIRRTVLAVDIAAFAAAGYWIGQMIGGPAK